MVYLSCLICGVADADSDFPKINPEDAIAKANKAAGAEPLYECKYQARPLLFKKIEEEKWEEVNLFLKTEKWPGIALFPDLAPKFQAMTVVTNFTPKDDGQPAKVQWRRLPLQQAVINGAPVSTIRRLLTLFPQAARWANNDGQLAIHLALLLNASDAVVSVLAAEYPESIRAKTKLGYSPFQAAMKCKESEDRGMILAIFTKYTKKLSASARAALFSKVMIPDKKFHCKKYTHCAVLCPLYKMIEEAEGDWSDVMHFLKTGKSPFLADAVADFFWGGSNEDEITLSEQVQTWVTRRNPFDGEEVWSHLPLHLAIIIGAPMPVINRLIELHPQAILYGDAQGFLPIHLALQHGAGNDIVAKLLLSFPESVNKKTLKGLTPLDCALRAKNTARGTMLETFVKVMANARKDKKNELAVAIPSPHTAETRDDYKVEKNVASPKTKKQERDTMETTRSIGWSRSMEATRSIGSGRSVEAARE